MKKLILLSSFIAFAHTLSAQVKIGQPVNDLKINTVLNANVKSTNLANFKGKVLILEFWATWCSPCVEAIAHLQQLQKQYVGKLQVITVTDETEKRIRQFLKNKPSNLWFAIDTGDFFRKDFPYRTIPHSVVIDKNGIVAAITEPDNITPRVIADLIAGKSISLPLKEDNMVENPVATYFAADKLTPARFLVQPEIAGLGSSSRSYLTDSIFKNRRLTFLNLPLSSVYRIASGGFSFKRTIDSASNAKNENVYCIDIIVPRGKENELLPTLKNELNARFELKAHIEKMKKQVFVLSVADRARVAGLKQSPADADSFSARAGEFNGEGVGLEKIAHYLEDFGIVKLPVVDETRDHNKYDIAFSFMPEKAGDLAAALNHLGLKLTQAEREIDILVIK